MKVAVLGAGPAGLYFAISMKRRNPAHEVTVFERNQPDDTFGWGVVLSAETLDNLAANDAGERRLRSASTSPTGTTSPSSTRACAPSRPGTASAASAASGCSCCCSGAPASSASSCASRPRSTIREPFMASHDLVVGADGLNSRVARGLRRGLQARHRRAQVQVRLARHPPEVRRRLHLHLRGDRARLGVGARLPVRRRDRDLHRRMQRGDLGRLGLRRHDAASSRSRPASGSSPSISAATA